MRFQSAVALLGLTLASGTPVFAEPPGDAAPARASAERGSPVVSLFGPSAPPAPVHPELDRLDALLRDVAGRPGATVAQGALDIARAALQRARADMPSSASETNLARAALAAAEHQIAAEEARRALVAAERALDEARRESQRLAEQVDRAKASQAPMAEDGTSKAQQTPAAEPSAPSGGR